MSEIAANHQDYRIGSLSNNLSLITLIITLTISVNLDHDFGQLLLYLPHTVTLYSFKVKLISSIVKTKNKSKKKLQG